MWEGGMEGSVNARRLSREAWIRLARAASRIGSRRHLRPLSGHPRATIPETSEAGRVSPDEIACRAYELYLARGGEPGHDLEDWLQAERELCFPSAEG